MPTAIYPLLFTPVYKDYIWGGNRIPQTFNRKYQQEICAESWEIADRPEGMSIVANGPLAGISLHELVTTMREKLLGISSIQPGTGAPKDQSAGNFETFPLLIKIIDAKQRLSVQVHPDNQTAATHGGEAKTEMWYVLDAEPNAQVFVGLKSGTNRQSFKEALNKERLDDVLRSVPVKPGEAIYVPGGRVHAIGEGCLLLEIQQNSNTTYRVYDWGRLGKNGKPRELHLAQAFQVINWKDNASAVIEPRELQDPGSNRRWEIIKCPYFHVTRLELSTPRTAKNDGRNCSALFTVSGKIDIEGNGFVAKTSPGTSCLIPAALTNYTLTPVNGNAIAIQIN